MTKLKQAMMAQVDRNNITANNLSNLGTTGFKKDQLFFHTLSDELDISEDMSKATNFEQGQLLETGNPLDIALAGEGFFTVETENGTAFTRDGAFHIDTDGTLRNKSNLPVLGDGGWINVISEFGTPKEVVITERGEVYADGNLIDKLQITGFENEKKLTKIGSSIYTSKDINLEYAVEEPNVKQGFLEASNVNAAQEMVELIEIQRQFEGVQRMVRAMDDVYKQAVQQVGRYR